MARCAVAALAGLTILAAALVPASLEAQPLSIRNSFRIGSSGVLCSAQLASGDKRLSGLFDRAYRLTCRDAATAVGSVIAVRRDIAAASPAMGLGSATLSCQSPKAVTVEGVGRTDSLSCHDPRDDVDYRRYVVTRGHTRYLAEGLAGYDPVLRLALASIVNDRPQPGEVSVAATEVSDSASFARIQAGVLDAEGARDEAYARNNDGRFAESAEFFQLLAQRADSRARKAELLANAGLQQSNLGNFAAARSMFDNAEKEIARNDGVTQRLLRNYRAISLLNQRQWQAALAVLDQPTADVSLDYDLDAMRTGVVSEPIAYQINRENMLLQRLGGVDSGLTLREKATILDGQADGLRGTALAREGQADEADKALERADKALLSVRGGRVLSIRWLRAQTAMERGDIAEGQGKRGQAAGHFTAAVKILEESHPGSPALLAARARQAGFLARTGDTAAARAQFAAVVSDAEAVTDSSAALRNLLTPYFEMLVAASDQDAPTLMFRAMQSMQRPGVAQTQAVLARELSEGNDEAAALFRLSVSRTREIVRTEVEITDLAAVAEPSGDQIARLAAARETLDALKAEQTRITAQLAKFPRYKAIAPTSVPLSELQAALKDGEGYFKVTIVGDGAYALFATGDSAQIHKIAQDRATLERSISTLRDSIVQIENGQVVTYPFDIALAHSLYEAVMGAFDARIASTKHLIFEPDGPLLEIPPSLMVRDAASVDRYKAKVAKGGDDFDFTGTEWLGRGRLTTIAVSPRAFVDVRAIAPSHGGKAYLGVGNNAAPASFPVGQGAEGCDWPLSTWQNPIDPGELKLAASILGTRNSTLMTGASFSDTVLLKDAKLSDYRIIHFATHGLVTAPRPQCPARPALVTSFGDANSDGLLSFREIFDLHLDADLVVLSACDTAGMATVGASREAGVPTGGNFALDGLVRAFVGAGARSVIASHWPVPDDFGATQTLISGLYTGKSGDSIGLRLDTAQMKLMDNKDTSHPFYWAAFVILGDGAKPLTRK